MSNAPSALVHLRDPRIASHALRAEPVWLWSTDGTRILWTNAAGAAALDHGTVSALATRQFDCTRLPAAQIARLAASLPHSGAPRLERLRGLGLGLGRLLPCACSHITLEDGTHAILVIGQEIQGAPLPLAERVRRLFEGFEEPIAAFSSTGELIYATVAASSSELLAGPALPSDALAAMQAGHPHGIVAGAPYVRLGAGTTSVIVMTLLASRSTLPASQRQAETTIAAGDLPAALPPISTSSSRSEPQGRQEPRLSIPLGSQITTQQTSPPTVEPLRSLSSVEHKTFRDLGRQLSARLRGEAERPPFDGGDDHGPARRSAVAQPQSAEAEPTANAASRENPFAAKVEFLARIGHDIRVLLNTIVGFSEAMLEERFGPIANERYRDYLGHIRSAGGQVAELLDDLGNLSKLEAGELKLGFASVQLNEIVQACVTQTQPQVSRARVLMRTALVANLPAVSADAGSLRQMVTNLIANSVKCTRAGGQIIVSTAIRDSQYVTLRVRDSGIVRNAEGRKLAPQPPNLPSSPVDSSDIELRLALTKALAHANGAAFTIVRKVGAGSLVEIAFRAARPVLER